MTRLTTYIRDQIVSNALKKSGYTAAREAYNKRRAIWIEACRVRSLGISETELKSIQGAIKKLEDRVPSHLHSGRAFINTSSHLSINAAGESELLGLHDVVPVSRARLTLLQGDELVAERELLKAEDARLDEQYASVRAAVRAAVNTPTTIKALLAAWPEVKELLPAQLAEAKTQLPAVQVADLNALVGLPSE